jgi:RNA polymerase sigma factor (sigma-70 family)
MTNLPNQDESLIVAKIAQQDQTAFSLLYDRYARLVYALAYRILGSIEEAEEVVLDVFAQVWRTADRYDLKRGRVDAWLCLLARSRALDRLRSLKRSARAVEASENAAIAEPTTDNKPEESLMITERREIVQAAIGQLPTEQQQVLVLAYFQGLTHKEIAAQTGQPLGTVKTRIRLGLVKLKDILQPE